MAVLSIVHFERAWKEMKTGANTMQPPTGGKLSVNVNCSKSVYWNSVDQSK